MSAADSSSHSRGRSQNPDENHVESWLEKLDVKSRQENDHQIKPILTMVRRGTREPLHGAVCPALRSLWSQWSRLVVSNGILYRKWETEDGNTSHLQLVVPKTLTKDVLKSLHSQNTAAHLGYEKTFNKVKARFYWFGYQRETEQFCKQCEMCAASKAPPYTVKAPLQQDPPSYPWERIAMDVVGPLPRTEAGNRFILVVSDYFTKWPEAFALKDHKAETIAAVLVDEVICRHGVPRSIHTDQGRDFESTLLKNMCELLEVEKTRTTAYHPESDGLVERLNKTLVTMLRTCVDEEQKNWDTLLPKILLGYRTSVQTTTGYSPFRLVYGREAMLPVDIMFGGSKERFSTQNRFVNQQDEFLEKAFEMVRSHSKLEQKRQKYYYDRRVHPSCKKVKYDVGDWVRVYNPSTKRGQVRKLKRCYRGPYRVIKVISDVVYRVQRVNGRQRIVVHYNRLKDANQEKTMESAPYETPQSTATGPSEGENPNDAKALTDTIDDLRGVTISDQLPNGPDALGQERDTSLPTDGHTQTVYSGVDDMVGAQDISTPSENVNQSDNSGVHVAFDSASVSPDSTVIQTYTNEQSNDTIDDRSISSHEADTLVAQQTRVGRITKRPAHFNDFVM